MKADAETRRHGDAEKDQSDHRVTLSPCRRVFFHPSSLTPVPVAPGETLDHRNKLVSFDWLRDVSVVTRSDCANTVRRARISGQRNRRHVIAVLVLSTSYLLNQLVPISF
jgi:hypothetical protein